MIRRTVLKGIGALAALSALAPLRSPAAEPLRIGVIGAGWQGGTLGRLWVRAGHEVMFSSRNLDRVRADIAGLGARATAGTSQQAAAFGSVLLFATPYDALPELGRELAEEIRGKIVLDACNPPAGSALAREAESIGVGVMSARLLPGTRLVRAFSSVDATQLEASAGRSTDKLAVPLASDDEDALHVAAQLVRDAGSEPVIVGPLAEARLFQRGGPGFRLHTNAPELRRRLGLTEEVTSK
ncbi:MAG: NADPH-dependent F420 reductase [Gammaproteobacteria bacterium]|nr:MAG: NADPH-dependent F420 reductase [Gammaproteobacteria bacterium]